MKNLVDTPSQILTADEILDVPANKPELLFSPDANAIKVRYRELVRIWHPDVCPLIDAAAVLAHLTTLSEYALEQLSNGTWHIPGQIIFVDQVTGKKHTLKYVKRHDFELGELYISSSVVTFAIMKDFTDLFKNACDSISHLKYADDAMQAEFSGYIPEIHKIIESSDRHVMVIVKNPNLILLADLLEFQGGKIDPRHVAWIMSRMHNLCCFLEYNLIAHNDISLQCVFINPKDHSCALLGGWWYSASAWAQIKALPRRTAEIVPPKMLSSGLADNRIDLMLVRAIGRTLLGDPLGMNLYSDKNVPSAMTDWLTLPPLDSARQDYDRWFNSVLPASFGPRRFVELPVRFDDVYQGTK